GPAAGHRTAWRLRPGRGTEGVRHARPGAAGGRAAETGGMARGRAVAGHSPGRGLTPDSGRGLPPPPGMEAETTVPKPNPIAPTGRQPSYRPFVFHSQVRLPGCQITHDFHCGIKVAGNTLPRKVGFSLLKGLPEKLNCFLIRV